MCETVSADNSAATAVKLFHPHIFFLHRFAAAASCDEAITLHEKISEPS
jgi:hypothetical protein